MLLVNYLYLKSKAKIQLIFVCFYSNCVYTQFFILFCKNYFFIGDMCYNECGRLGKLASIELQRIEEERIRLLKEIELLHKQYEFYNQFHFDDHLGQAIASLIREVDGVDCVCQKIVCEIPEHTEVVQRKLPGNRKKQDVDKHFNRKVYTYVAVLEKDRLPDNFQFNTFNDMKKFLHNYCLAYVDYFGILNPQILSIKFPYLKLFFHLLNEWRFETGRATIDEDIVLNATGIAIHNNVVQNVYMHSSWTR